MSAYGAPAAAGQTAGPFVPDRRDWLRLVGGILFAAGAVVLAFRKGNDWGDWALFLVFLVPTVVLYAAASAGSRVLSALQGWQSAFYAFGILLLPATLVAFVNAIDNNADGRLNAIWIFGASTAVAALTAVRKGAWWQMLIAGIYAIVTWIALWSKILDNPSANTIRWLLIALAALLLLAAAALAREKRPYAADLITAAGISAILAGALSLAGLNSSASGISGLVSDNLPKPTQGWNIYLLIVSLALLAYGARSVIRGPGYVGAIGLTIFIFLVGLNVVGRLKGDDATAVAGWPLVLLIGGGALLAASFAMPRADGGPGTTEPPGGGPHDRTAAYAQPPAPPQQPPPTEQWRSQPPPPPGGGQPPQG